MTDDELRKRIAEICEDYRNDPAYRPSQYNTADAILALLAQAGYQKMPSTRLRVQNSTGYRHWETTTREPTIAELIILAEREVGRERYALLPDASKVILREEPCNIS
jgi:hypothetical protein